MQLRKNSPLSQRQYVLLLIRKNALVVYNTLQVLLEVPEESCFTMKHVNRGLTNNFSRTQSREPNTTSKTLGSE